MLTARLRDSLRRELGTTDRREAMATLLDVHALHLAPIEELGGAECWQHDPRVAALKRRLESTLRAQLDADRAPPSTATRPTPCVDSPTTRWCRRSTTGSPRTQTLDELVEFISLEGGPDADFDDLVAICQVGLRGLPKLTLGANYWDEMGRGRPLGGAH